MNQVLAMEDRYAWEILESAVDEVEILAIGADTRVGMKARKDGVGETLCRQGNARHGEYARQEERK
jgi:hypothetical protein